MHYFDARINQRFIGEISADGRTIEGRRERDVGDAGDAWEIDFPINSVRKQRSTLVVGPMASGADRCTVVASSS